MQVFVNGKRRQGWSAKEDAEVSLKTNALPLVGRVLSIEEARRSSDDAVARELTLAALVALGFLLVGFVLAKFNCLTSPAFVVLASSPFSLVFFGFALWRSLARRRAFQDRLAAEAALRPSPGTKIVLDENAVTIAGRAVGWNELEPERIDATEVSSDGDATITIQSLLAVGAGHRIAFDRYAIENGDLLVNAAYVKLVRQPMKTRTGGGRGSTT